MSWWECPGAPPHSNPISLYHLDGGGGDDGDDDGDGDGDGDEDGDGDDGAGDGDSFDDNDDNDDVTDGSDHLLPQFQFADFFIYFHLF